MSKDRYKHSNTTPVKIIVRKILNMLGIVKIQVVPVLTLGGIYYGVLYKYLFSDKWHSEFGEDGFRVIYTREKINELGYKYD